MALQNRVLPTGEIVAHPSKAGMFMGNRGILHDRTKSLGTSRWRHKTWVICQLSFKDRKRSLMAEGRYTELFFLDEATALGAGHRPCGECRKADYRAYCDALFLNGRPDARKVADIDALLHEARIVSRTRSQITHEGEAQSLPNGTMVALEGACWLVRNGMLCRYTPLGYDRMTSLPPGRLTVLTPAPSVEALRNGYRPVLHPSLTALIGDDASR